MRKSYIKNCIKHSDAKKVTDKDIKFLAEETKTNEEFVKEELKELNIIY